MVIMGHFLPFNPPLEPKKSGFWKNGKNFSRDHHFTNLHQKPQPHEVQFLRYRVSFGPFLPFYPPNNLANQNFEKQVYQKSWSYDVCFLRCGMWHVLSLWVIFCYFKPLLNRKLKFRKKYANCPNWVFYVI